MTAGDRAGQGTSLLLLIDGYNVIAPTAPPQRTADPRWLDRQRSLLIKRLVQHLESAIRRRTCVVFDAANPPPDQPDQFAVEGVDVRFAVGYPEADDLLEELIATHSSPKSLAVVSSDHRLQAAAKRRGSTPFDSQDWLDDLLDGSVRLADKTIFVADSRDSGESKPEKPSQPGKEDVASWMREFGFDGEQGRDDKSL